MELNRVLGGSIVPGSPTFRREPGKSTLLLQISLPNSTNFILVKESKNK
jgi:predicted ATP-dependent serine protease